MTTSPRDFLRRSAAAAILLLLSGLSAGPAAQQGPPAGRGHQPRVSAASRHDRSEPLINLPQLPPRAVGAVLRRKLLPHRIGSEGAPGDGALQDSAPATGAPTSAQNFEGVGNVNFVLPPDTVGDIGPNHYVQMVNLSFAIYDRSGNKLYGPVGINTLWQGFGGPCETTNDGDPIVLYDHLADRWILSQFALPNFPSGPFYQCIAISTTGNPTGAYYRYQFTISGTKLNDYPKFGVWPDGYYMSVNQFTCNPLFCSWAGQAVVAFDRNRMLSGQSAQMVYFDLFGTNPNLGGMLPADLDGPAPPVGAPNPYCEIDDDAWGYSPDQIQCWRFHVDWVNPANSTFTFDAAYLTAAFDSNMCGYSRNCIPQRGTSVRVDAISDRLMFRLQYRNFGTHQTLVTNHTVDANGLDRAGIRWYELRNAGAGWSIFQQGTYSPDSNHRWMGSAAMNGAGDISLGFSISSGTVFPSIRATGRLAADTAGQMTQGELTIRDGTGYQTHSSGRWGDYSMMAVDPVDDCTFWYTQEYYAVPSSASWQTRIGAFSLTGCGPPNNAPTVTLESPAEGATVAGTVPIRINASDTEDTAGTLLVEWNVDGDAWKPTTYNSSTLRYEATWTSTAASDGAHTVNARATDSGGKSATDSNAVIVDNVTEPLTSHVGDLDRSSTSQGSRWTAAVTIAVHNASHSAVAGATVSGTWSNGASGTSSCTTGGTGRCTVSKGSIRKNTSSVTFTVSNVTHSTLTYNSTGNHDPDGDSNGITITVTKP